MSLLINWEKLTDAESRQMCQTIQQFIDETILPDWLLFLRVESFQWGSVPPSVEIVDIGKPLDAFHDNHYRQGRFNNHSQYNNYNNNVSHSSSPVRKSLPSDDSSSAADGYNGSPVKPSLSYNPRPQNVFDSQVIVNFEYSGDLSISISTEFAVNIPSAAFMSLPVRFTLKKMTVKCSLVFGYVGSSLFHICILNPSSSDSSGNGILPQHLKQKILPLTIQFETSWDVGDAEKRVLKNSSKLEPFLHELCHKIINDHFLFPKFHTIDLSTAHQDLDEDLD